MKEELNKKAEEYVNKIFIYSNGALVHSALIEFAEEAIKDETRELKRELEELEKENAELKEENAELKKEWQEQVQKATDEGYARTLQTIQLTKAKDKLKRIKNIFYNGEANDRRLVQIGDILSEVEK